MEPRKASLLRLFFSFFRPPAGLSAVFFRPFELTVSSPAPTVAMGDSSRGVLAESSSSLCVASVVPSFLVPSASGSCFVSPSLGGSSFFSSIS